MVCELVRNAAMIFEGNIEGQVTLRVTNHVGLKATRHSPLASSMFQLQQTLQKIVLLPATNALNRADYDTVIWL